MTGARCAILPPYLVERLTQVDYLHIVAAGRRTLLHDRQIRNRRDAQDRTTRRLPRIIPEDLRRRAQPLPPTEPDLADETADPRRSVFDAENSTVLPGRLVRFEGGPPTGYPSVDEAYDGLGHTWRLFHEVYARDSLDDDGLPLHASVHFGVDYDNAFWDGSQMVFGDGDGVYIDSFTASVDVIGHELTHGVTQYTAGLVYLGQSGALNESVSDVFGSLVKQRMLGHDAAEADWLIGAEVFTDRVHGVALRSMRAPGTAYDDAVLGKDPQPATMDGYVDLPHDAEHDNGGVHVNSGIPNHAFYLAATAIDGPAWQGAGQVWYDTLTAGGLPRDVDFSGFAAATVTASTARFGADAAQTEAIRSAWAQVGVLDES